MITLLSGTNRPGSNTRKVTQHVEEIYHQLGVTTEVLDLAQLPPELFAPTSYAAKPAGFEKFSHSVVNSDGIVVITPEYNGGMPGVLKYFIDMLPFPESFENRPVCFVGLAAGMWGALRPVEQLQAIFGYRNAYIFPQRVFIPGVGKVISAEGKLTDNDLSERLRGQADGFVTFVEQLRGKSLRA